MHLILTGLNHKTAAVGLRERVSFDQEAVEQALADLVEVGLEEAVILSTCNRTEIYGVYSCDSLILMERLSGFLAARAGVPRRDLVEHLYNRHDRDVVEHLLRVASGLDSLVLGEPQILGQVRGAFETAYEADRIHSLLTRLFLNAIETGKKVRSNTGLGEMPVSVASISIQLAERVFGELSGAKVLVIGAGEVCTAAALHISRRNPCELNVVNRTACKAEQLASRCCGSAAPWEEMVERLSDADVVLSCTGATEPVITTEMLREVMRRRRGHHLLAIDLGVPRDIEIPANGVDNLYAFDIDDLNEIANEHMSQRHAEVPRAEQIVDRALERYLKWKASLSVVPTIVDLRAQLEDIRCAGVEQFISKFPDLDEGGRKHLEQMTQTIVNRILHQPQIRLKQPTESMTSATLSDSLRYLFALDTADKRR